MKPFKLKLDNIFGIWLKYRLTATIFCHLRIDVSIHCDLNLFLCDTRNARIVSGKQKTRKQKKTNKKYLIFFIGSP